MLQLKQIDKIPYVEYGNVYHQICYEGVNVVGATVYITHTERAKVDDTFFVSIHGSNVKASHSKEKSMSDAKSKAQDFLEKKKNESKERLEKSKEKAGSSPEAKVKVKGQGTSER